MGDIKVPGKHIIAVDGSSCAGLAFEHAAKTLPKSDEFVVINGVRIQPFTKPATTASFHQTEEQMPDVLKKYTEMCKTWNRKCSFASSHYRSLSELGSNIDFISKQEGARSVVVGSRGLAGAARMMLGSVSYSILNSVDLPVTVVKGPPIMPDEATAMDVSELGMEHFDI